MFYYSVNHNTGKVLSLSTTTKGLKLMGHNPEAKLYAVYQPGHSYFGGQGRPQLYAPAQFTVLQAVTVKDLGGGIEEIGVHSYDGVLQWPYGKTRKRGF